MGNGISHILARLGPEDMTRVIDTIASGTAIRTPTGRINIQKGDIVVSLDPAPGSLGQRSAWIATGRSMMPSGFKNTEYITTTRFDPKLENLKDAETIRWSLAPHSNKDGNIDWPASWDRRLLTTPEFRHMVEIYDFNETSSGTGNHLLHGRIGEAIASGDSATVVALTRPLTFTREGDTIHVSGAALGTRIDRYDFEKGKSSADLALQAQSVGDGHPFTHIVTWPLQVSGRIRIVDGVLQRPELEFTDPPEGDLR